MVSHLLLKCLFFAFVGPIFSGYAAMVAFANHGRIKRLLDAYDETGIAVDAFVTQSGTHKQVHYVSYVY